MRLLIALFTCAFATSQFCSTAVGGDEDWPQFRGANGSGIGSGKPPVRWNVETGKNIKWKASIDGLGHSCPIVSGKRVFVTTAVNEAEPKPTVGTGFLAGTGDAARDRGEWVWQLLCLDLRNGEVLWTRDLHKGEPQIQRHLKGSHANSTPATDGKRVVAMLGSEGIYCVSVEGEMLWQKKFGRLHSGPYDAPELEWGFGSSPVIHNDQVIVQCDCLNEQFIAILDLETGEEVRRIKRDDVASWSTPLVVSTEDGDQVVCNGYRQMASYDLKSGERLWLIQHGGDVPVPTPLCSDGLVFITNAHGRNPLFAVGTAARGDLTPTAQNLKPDGIAWWEPRGGSYIPTPLVLDGLIYTGDDDGRLAVRDAKNGELVYRNRIGPGTGNFTASAVAAGGHIYYVRESGDVCILKAGRQYELVAQNRIDGIVMATPAIAQGQILIRTTRELYCIGK